ncbi:MAG: Rieske 2Fe-2S domain-containing protein [Alphaproteobacteria bacterium]|nr:Rieske 2Fe-2S domain-containing protein [Alphaproteobacteria bacterium]
MTTASEGAELTEVGPGTPMGTLMRHYWLPALYSSELERDGPPVRLMLLGERLIAFRDSAGKVGVMDHRCPHRCASLFLGRNEQGGIRCIYHGWKFDTAGNCLDMPSLTEDQDFRHKVHARAYRTVERAGLVWVYMGERPEPPALPAFEVLDLPADEINVSLIQRDCNWLQAMDGELDTAHFGFLHAGHVDPDDVPDTDPFYYTITNRAPQYQVRDAPWGTQYAGYRAAGPGRTYWRFANYLFPCWAQAPNGEFMSHMHARGWVPLDDHHTMFVFIWWKKAVSAMSLPQPAYKDGTPIGGTGRGGLKFLPNTTDWLGRWRMAHNAGNDWGMDRDKQRANAIYSGIDGVHLHDPATTESIGPVTDFAWEHLAPSDQMITRTRRRILRATRALRDDGTLPPGADEPEVYRGARSGYFITPDDGTPWQEVYDRTLAGAMHPGSA